MRTNWDTVPDVEDRTSVPEGVYDVQIVEVQERETRDGSDRWALRLEVCAGEYTGRHAGWDGLVWSERGMPRVKQLLSVLGLPVEGEQELQPDDLTGLRGRVQLVPEEYENPLGVITRRMSVPYDGWAPADEATEGDVDGGRATREALGRDSPF